MRYYCPQTALEKRDLAVKSRQKRDNGMKFIAIFRTFFVLSKQISSGILPRRCPQSRALQRVRLNQSRFGSETKPSFCSFHSDDCDQYLSRIVKACDRRMERMDRVRFASQGGGNASIECLKLEFGGNDSPSLLAQTA